MTTKNPFEIRTEILAMAKDYMDKQQEIANAFAKQAFEAALESGKVTADTWASFVPKAYTVEELTKKAQEFYGFVSHAK